MFVLRGSFVNGAVMWQLCSSPDFSPSCDPSKSSKPECAQSLCCSWLTFWWYTSHIYIDTIKWIWSCGTALFPWWERTHCSVLVYLSSGLSWSSIPGLWVSARLLFANNMPTVTVLHQLLSRISHNKALLLWGSAQFSIETEGAASRKVQAEAQLLVLLPVLHRSVLWHR